MTIEPPWKPSRGEQRLEWWLKLIARYPIGCGGMVYEALIAREPLGVLAFAALGASVDLGKIFLSVLRVLLSESREMERLLAEDEARDGSRGSADGSR